MIREFDIDDNKRIVELIGNRKEGAYVIPLYIRIYNKRIDLRDIDEIDNFIPSAMRIGFGGLYGVLNKTQFPIKYIDQFDIVRKFTNFDEKINVDYQYFVFESSDPYWNIDHEIFDQVDYYYWMIRMYLEERMKMIRKKRIEETLKENEYEWYWILHTPEWGVCIYFYFIIPIILFLKHILFKWREAMNILYKENIVNDKEKNKKNKEIRV